jgi:hypothetical protein
MKQVLDWANPKQPSFAWVVGYMPLTGGIHYRETSPRRSFTMVTFKILKISLIQRSGGGGRRKGAAFTDDALLTARILQDYQTFQPLVAAMVKVHACDDQIGI